MLARRPEGLARARGPCSPWPCRLPVPGSQPTRRALRTDGGQTDGGQTVDRRLSSAPSALSVPVPLGPPRSRSVLARERVQPDHGLPVPRPWGWLLALAPLPCSGRALPAATLPPSAAGSGVLVVSCACPRRSWQTRVLESGRPSGCAHSRFKGHGLRGMGTIASGPRESSLWGQLPSRGPLQPQDQRPPRRLLTSARPTSPTDVAGDSQGLDEVASCDL